jgi:phosphoglycolate phosphatase
MYVCLFDIDGTLIHTAGAGIAALRTTMQTVYDRDASATEVVTTGRTDRAIVEELFELHGVERSDENWQVYLAAYLEHLPVALAECKGRVLPGIPDLLATLGAREDVALGLLTGNSHPAAQHKLGHYGLNDHFTFGGFGSDHTDRDDVARLALAEVDGRFDGSITPDRIFVIGDTPLDVRCARAIGAQAIAVATGTHDTDALREAKPDLLVEDFSNAAPFLGLLVTA